LPFLFCFLIYIIYNVIIITQNKLDLNWKIKMVRHIPRKSKIKMEFWRGITIADIIVAVVGFFMFLLLLFSNIFSAPFSFYFALSFLVLWASLFMKINEQIRLYYGLVLLFKFSAYKKKYYRDPKNPNDDISRVIPFEGLSTDKFISFGDYYAQVIEILPSTFFLLTEEKQEMVIRTLSQAFTRLNSNQKLTIVKTRKPMLLDNMLKYEDTKYNTLIDMSERGLYSASELDSRSAVFEERLKAIRFLNENDRIIKNHFYIVVYDIDREALNSTVRGIVSSLESSVTPIYTNPVEGNQLLVFLKSTFTDQFDERELELISENDKIKWVFPQEIEFKAMTTRIDGRAYRAFSISDYPLEVVNAWLYPLFRLEESKIVVNIEPIDRYNAERMIDKSLMEVEMRMGKDMSTSRRIETQTHFDTLKGLLTSLKNNNENLFNTNIHIIADENIKKEVRAVLKQGGFKFDENFAKQIDGFVSANISTLDLMKSYQRGIPTSTLAAMFPFISNYLHDERGFYLGYNPAPVFTNFFARNNERVNSNIMVIGKSGSGKSFATKTLLSNFAADNTRVFILDPENEYEVLCKNLRGKTIDVGASTDGIFNPFHIYPSLEAQEGESDDSYSAHLQFLEQFYRLILPGMSPDAFEKLNSITVGLYKRKNIDASTPVEKLSPKNFPIFDDLLEMVDELIALEKVEYHLRNLLTVRTYVEKFATGGRNSNLWNGPTTIQTNENFVCFSFRSLIVNRNETIANAQMLLIFKYLDNEIIRNRDFNLKYFANEELEEDHRRIVVAVDEAHVFINKKFPIALDFMAQMAKRIRKYHGMLIIITQNIKDFVGNEEIQTQSTAVINACQYSMIFSLSPNDISDLISLYRNAGGINDEEKDAIVTARRGQAFLITGPMNRTMVQIDALTTTREIFESARYYRADVSDVDLKEELKTL